MDIIYQEYFNYYLELERDFFATESYITIDRDNYMAFSMQYNRIFQSICSEIDCLFKELCGQVDASINVFDLLKGQKTALVACPPIALYNVIITEKGKTPRNLS